MGKNIVITGAGGILCSMFAENLARGGHKIALIDINYDAVKNAEDKITSSGGIAKAYKADILNKENLSEVYESIKNDIGKCEVLINGAGGNSPKCTTDKEIYSGREGTEGKTFFDLDRSGFEFVFDLNMTGTFLATQVFAADMEEAEGACIINVSSMNAYRPLTKIPAYSAAKAAVSNFTQWLAVYFSKAGIRVNAIAPGFFVTNQNYALLYDKEGNMTPRSEKIINSTPMKRFGKPEELLGTLDWLIDEEKSGFVTGITIPIDGGFSAYSGV